MNKFKLIRKEYELNLNIMNRVRLAFKIKLNEQNSKICNFNGRLGLS